MLHMLNKGPVTPELRSSRLCHALKILTAWCERGRFCVSVDQCVYTTISLRLYHALAALNTTSPRSQPRSPPRLHYAHCVFTTIKPIPLRPSDAFTACMPRSSRLHCALITLLLRLHHALITRPLRWPRPHTLKSSSVVLQLPCC